MEGALAKCLAKSIECDGLVEMLLDITADLFREVGLRIAAECSRAATQASAKTGFLRLFRMRIELNLLAPRPAGPTRGPAIKAGRGVRRVESSRAFTVPRLELIPK